METLLKKRQFTHEKGNELDEHIRLLKEDANEPNLFQGKAMQELPEWFDKEKFRRGQKFFKDNYFALFVSKLCGLLVTLSIPKVLKILIMTNKSSRPTTAFKRYLSTLTHMLMWYNGDVFDENSWAYKSLDEVYKKHLAANKMGLSEKAGSLSQASLAITQFGFMGFGVLRPERLGMRIDDEKDLEGFIHFWRTIGYLIGVDDKYNICKGNVEETKELCRRILEEVLRPHLMSPSKEFTQMTRVLLQGMWAVVPFVDAEGFMAFTYDLSGLNVEPFTNWWSRLIYHYQKYAHTLLNGKYLGNFWRSFFNFQTWLAIVLANKFPLLSYFLYKIPIPSSEA